VKICPLQHNQRLIAKKASPSIGSSIIIEPRNLSDVGWSTHWTSVQVTEYSTLHADPVFGQECSRKRYFLPVK